jgi:hypothetical protein
MQGSGSKVDVDPSVCQSQHASNQSTPPTESNPRFSKSPIISAKHSLEGIRSASNPTNSSSHTNSKRDSVSGPASPPTSHKKASKPSPTSQPSGPVLVNPGTPSSDRKMHMPTSQHSLTRSNHRFKPHSPNLPPPPSPASFSISSILSSLSSDPSAQADIDAIAEICGRSRLSMANEYGSHRSPIGSGIDVHMDDDDLEGEEDRAIHTYPFTSVAGLALDTNVGIYHGMPGSGLEPVEELPTPLSEGSRMGSNPPEVYGSNSVSVSGPSQSPTVSATSEDANSQWTFLGIWERSASLGRGRQASQSVLGLSMDVEAIGEGESFTNEARSELREDISGAGGSRAVRQLMRVVGG